MQGDQFLTLLKGVRKVGENAYLAFCPAHDNTNTQALSIKLADRILVHCFSCKAKGPEVCEALGLDKGELNYDYQATSRNGAGTAHLNGHVDSAPLPPLSLEAFAAAKGLPVAFLGDMGVAEEKGVLKFRYLDARGQRAARQRLRHTLERGVPDRRFTWSSGSGRPIAYGLWQLTHAKGDLYLVEGETDSLTLWLYDFACIGIPGADLTGCLQEQALSGFSRVFIVKEADRPKPGRKHGGETFEEGLTARLAALSYDGEVRVLDMEDLGCKDANEAHLKFAWDFPKKWAEASGKARKVELPMVGLEVTMASDIKPEKVEWLWDKKVPIGKITVFVGDPKKGKSFVTLDIASRLSNGALSASGSSLIFSGEDSASDTIVPRLRDMGADLTRIGIVNLTRKSWNGQIIRREFNLGTDLDDLRKRLQRHPEIRLIVIDPFASYLGGNDGNNNPQMRSLVLTPLARIAEEHRVAVILVMHFTKDSDKSVLDRVNGTKGTVAAARMIWAFVNYGRGSLMGFADSNIVAWQPGLAFHIEETEHAGVVVWNEKPVMARLEDVLKPEEDERGHHS